MILSDTRGSNSGNGESKRRRFSGFGKHSGDRIPWGVAVKEAASSTKERISDMKGDANENGTRLSAWDVVKAVLSCIWTIVKVTFRTIWRGLLYIFVMIVALAAIGLVGFGILLASSSGDLPKVQDYSLVSMPQDATIYDRDGQVIGVVAQATREPVAFGDISKNAKDALVSIEDERFYDHGGIDPIGILRSVYVNFKAWLGGGDATSQGASTITQQYVRNAYSSVGTEQTISRKLKEIALATEVDATMSKDDILNAYLNTVCYGNGQYGIQAASKYYFGHDVSKLSDYEAAMLAAIVNAPSMYDPTTDEGKKLLAQRTNLVLDKMYSLGKLKVTQEQLRKLKATDISSVIHITKKSRTINQPFYYDYVMGELHKKYTTDQIVSGGWQIYTTLSIKDGESATNIVKGIEQKYGSAGATSAIVDMNVSDGSINAFCGGTDYNASQFNVATQGSPQTGSTLKPFLYATLMEKQGYYTTDEYDHSEVNVAVDGEAPHIIKSYIRQGGDASIKNGIIQSDNAMAVHAAQNVGMDNVNAMMHECGFTSELESNPIAIIGGQTTGFAPLELATGYATIANGGTKRTAWCVKTITDSLGNSIYEHKDDSSYAMDKEVALQLTDAMKTAVDERPDWYDIPFDHNGGWTIAAKSGTTDDKADLWCCGFDTKHAVAVWIGNKDARTEMPTTTPTACHEFSDYMYAAHQGDPKEAFEEPKFKTTVPTPTDGESVSDYVSTLTGLRLNAKYAYVTPSSDHKDGSIVSVESAGKLVDRGTAVTVTIARSNVTVPDFSGMTPEQAYNAADGLDLQYSIKYVTSGSSTPSVKSQSVKAGNNVPKGTKVTLTIEMVTKQSDSTTEQVPYKSSDDAVSKLEAQVKELQQKNDDLQSQLNGQQQTNNSTTSMSQNTSSTNTATQAVTIPDVTGKSAASARASLESLGFVVTSSGATSSSSTVTSTSPSAGTQAAQGSTVRLICTN